jgi:flagellar biogenesis protein FliO
MSGEARTRKDWFGGLPAIRTLPEYRSMAAVRKAVGGALNQMRRLSNGVLSAHASRRLKVVETVSLGEKRFVSILNIDGEEFLLGGSASSVVVLAKLDSAVGVGQPFGSVLSQEKQNAAHTSQFSSDQTSESTR